MDAGTEFLCFTNTLGIGIEDCHADIGQTERLRNHLTKPPKADHQRAPARIREIPIDLVATLVDNQQR
jgi:hypothetical protein